MTPSEALDDIKQVAVEAAAKRSVVIPAAMIALGFLGLALGARYQRDAVGMLLGLALGYGVGETLASRGPGAPHAPPPYDPQEADPGLLIQARREPADAAPDVDRLRNSPPAPRQVTVKQGPPSAS